MSCESLLVASQRLSVSVEALAALGAHLRLQQQELEGDPRVRALLNEVVRAVDPQLLDNVDTRQQAAALAFIQTIFRQACPRSGVDLHRRGHSSITGTGVPSHRARD